MKGISNRSRFIKRKTLSPGFTASPLGDVLESNWVDGSWRATVFPARLRFPFAPLCVVTGKDDAEAFKPCSCADGRPAPVQAERNSAASFYPLPFPHKSVEHPSRFKSNALIKRNRPVVSF